MFMPIHVPVSEGSIAEDFSPLIKCLLMFFSKTSLMCCSTSLLMSPSYRGTDCCFLYLYFFSITFAIDL